MALLNVSVIFLFTLCAAWGSQGEDEPPPSILYLKGARVKLEPVGRVVIAEAVIPIVVHFESRVLSHEGALAEASKFACQVLKTASTDSSSYLRECQGGTPQPRSKRFIISAILGGIGAGTGIAALSEVRGLDRAIKKELRGIKAALKESNAAMYQIGSQAHIVTSAVRDLDAKVNSFHDQTKAAFRTLTESQSFFASALNSSLRSLKKQIVGGLHKVSDHSRIRDAIIVSRLSSRIAELDTAIDLLAENSVAAGHLPPWYVNLDAIAENITGLLKNHYDHVVDKEMIMVQLKQRMNVIHDSAHGFFLYGVVAAGNMMTLYSATSMPVFHKGFLISAQIPNVVQFHYIDGSKFYAADGIAEGCYAIEDVRVCLGASRIRHSDCVQSLAQDHLTGCPVKSIDAVHDCFTELIDQSRVYYTGVCSLRRGDNDEVKLTGEGVIHVGGSHTIWVDDVALYPTLSSASAFVEGYQFRAGEIHRLEVNISDVNIHFSVPSINMTDHNISLPNNTWYGRFKVHMSNTTRLVDNIGSIMKNVKLGGIAIPIGIMFPSASSFIAAQLLFDVLFLLFVFWVFCCRRIGLKIKRE